MEICYHGTVIMVYDGSPTQLEEFDWLLRLHEYVLDFY